MINEWVADDKPLTKKYREACFARQVKKIYISWSVIKITELLEYGDFFISVFDIANTLSYTACEYILISISLEVQLRGSKVQRSIRYGVGGKGAAGSLFSHL